MQLDRDPTVDVDELALIEKALAQQLLEARMNSVHAAPQTPEPGTEHNRDPQTNFASPGIANLEDAAVAPAEAGAYWQSHSQSESHSHSQSLVSSLAQATRARLLIVATDTTLVEVAALLSREQGSVVVVCELSGLAVGLITDGMLIHQLALAGSNFSTARAADVMQREFPSCSPSDSLARVLATMHQQSLVHLPVIDVDHRPVGMMTASDGLRALLAVGNVEESRLRDSVATRSDACVKGVGYP